MTELYYVQFPIRIIVHKNKRIKRKICFGQAVAVHGPLVTYITDGGAKLTKKQEN